MSLPRASRLSQQTVLKKPGILARKLPPGSWQRRATFGLALPFFLIVIIVLVADKLVMPIVTRHGTELELPNLTNERLTDAREKLTALGLSLVISSEEYSPGKEPGTVLGQYPVGGTRVKPGRIVKLVVSLGQKSVVIPDVSGKSVRQARLDLEVAGLMFGDVAWAFSDTIPERVVVFSYPAAGTEIPIGSPVNLMVNRGRASTFTYMPAVIGLPLGEAIKKIEDKSLRMGVTNYRTDENFLPETVLEQSEPLGTELDVGTEIDLVVSST